MKLIAKKPCNFGRQYFIGEEIPTECVLDPKAQEKMGVLVVVDEDSSDADPNEGGLLLPPSSTLEDHEINQEKKYSRYKLSRMNKEQLRAVAKEKGVEVADEMTNDKIIDLILESQGE